MSAEAAGAGIEVASVLILWANCLRWAWPRSIAASVLGAAGWWLLNVWIMTYIMVGMTGLGIWLWCNDESAGQEVNEDAGR